MNPYDTGRRARRLGKKEADNPWNTVNGGHRANWRHGWRNEDVAISVHQRKRQRAFGMVAFLAFGTLLAGAVRWCGGTWLGRLFLAFVVVAAVAFWYVDAAGWVAVDVIDDTMGTALEIRSENAPEEVPE